MTICIAQPTIDSYLTSNFIAQTPSGAIVMRVGTKNPELACLHSSHEVRSSCFVTAYNPFGVEPAAQANAEANGRLASYILEKRLAHYPGVGQGVDTDWPPEPSFLVLGVTLAEAGDLCRTFFQNAVVFSGADATPRLLFHPDFDPAGLKG